MSISQSIVRQQLCLLACACCGSLALCVITGASDHGFVLPLLALAYALIAAREDILSAQVPNRLLYPAIALVMLLYAIAALSESMSMNVVARWLGPTDAYSALEGIGYIGGLAVILFLLGAIGGGDAKLAALLGVSLGLGAALHVIWLAAVAGVVVGTVNALSRGWLNRKAQQAVARCCDRFGRAGTLAEFGIFELPLAVLVLIGLMIHLIEGVC